MTPGLAVPPSSTGRVPPPDRIEALHRELADEVRERVRAGVCGCGCGAPLGTVKGGRRYVNARHRQRAYRHRLELEAKVLAIPARLSLQALREYEPTRERHADAQEQPQPQKRRRSAPRPGVTLYLPSVDLAEQLAAELREVLDPTSQRGLGPRANAQPILDVVEAALERRRRRAPPPAAA
jgi:hypothetical protein